MWLYRVPGRISWLIKANLQTEMLNDVSGEANCKVHANYKYADSLSWAVTLPRKQTQCFYTKGKPKTT